MESSTIPLFFQFLLIVVMAMALAGLILAILGNKINSKWSKTSAYNIAGCLVVSSIIAGTISFLAVWIALPNSRAVDYSHQDVVVDILGVLVTVLIGWNIFSVVDIKKKAEKIDSISDDLESVISGIIQLSIHSFTMRPDKEAVINSCFLSLERVNNCDNEEVRKSAVREIMKVLHEVKKTYKSGDKIQIYKDQRERYQSILWMIDDEYKEEIREMIKNAIELSVSGEEIKFAEQTQQADYVDVGVSERQNNN